MRVLVIGNGAREHALAWKLADSSSVEEVFVAPGNAGTLSVATNLPIAVDDFDHLIEAAQRHSIDLTVVGPEAPLAAGLADRFREAGLLVAGPSAAAARIESSKVWAKEIMTAAGVPTGRSRSFGQAEISAALDAVYDCPLPVVIKASGLAAGKGVVIAETRDEAVSAVRSMLEDDAFGDAGHEVLIEAFLIGQEVSLLVLTDGETTYPLLPACDYKRVDDGDGGLNTGGMGAYTPVPAVDGDHQAAIMRTIIEPVLNEMRRRDIVYRGVLYAGLILTDDGPKVLEFNCRMGDPETEVILPMLRSDLGEMLAAAASGRLHNVACPEWEPGACVGVVLTSGGYPGSYRKGYPISGLDRLPEGVVAFHAGTRLDADDRVVTDGGRVLTLVAQGADFQAARRLAYQAVGDVRFTGVHYRHDIAQREE